MLRISEKDAYFDRNTQLDEDFIADGIPDDDDPLLKYDAFENDTLK